MEYKNNHNNNYKKGDNHQKMKKKYFYSRLGESFINENLQDRCNSVVISIVGGLYKKRGIDS